MPRKTNKQRIAEIDNQIEELKEGRKNLKSWEAKLKNGGKLTEYEEQLISKVVEEAYGPEFLAACEGKIVEYISDAKPQEPLAQPRLYPISLVSGFFEANSTDDLIAKLENSVDDDSQEAFIQRDRITEELVRRSMARQLTEEHVARLVTVRNRMIERHNVTMLTPVDVDRVRENETALRVYSECKDSLKLDTALGRLINQLLGHILDYEHPVVLNYQGETVQGFFKGFIVEAQQPSGSDSILDLLRWVSEDENLYLEVKLERVGIINNSGEVQQRISSRFLPLRWVETREQAEAEAAWVGANSYADAVQQKFIYVSSGKLSTMTH